MDLVKNAQNEKPQIQKLGDKVSAVFVPIVIALSILTFAQLFSFHTSIQQALLQSIAVLVVSCPCNGISYTNSSNVWNWQSS
ncbi:MAG: hypothetical protein IPP56_01870 [Bacteroidetes bacterium]|nr:hypothetical protein [Bacteroidota bacterium]